VQAGHYIAPDLRRPAEHRPYGMNKAWTVRVLVALVASALLDGVSTYIATPDLTQEANPVLVFTGRTWFSFIMLKILVSLLAIAAFAGGLRILQSRRDRLVGQSGFRNILSQLLFNRHVSLGEFLLYGWPKDWMALFAVSFLVFTMTVIAGGVTAAVMNSLNAIRSPSHLLIFWCGNAVLGTGIGLWLTRRFF
jgi:hypothetical protein